MLRVHVGSLRHSQHPVRCIRFGADYAGEVSLEYLIFGQISQFVLFSQLAGTFRDSKMLASSCVNLVRCFAPLARIEEPSLGSLGPWNTLIQPIS
jgi:hypothetical protein